jgi:hypothetical protein
MWKILDLATSTNYLLLVRRGKYGIRPWNFYIMHQIDHEIELDRDITVHALGPTRWNPLPTPRQT